MALISTKNLVTPLTNMVNIITVLLLAICFAVLRLSGAAVSVQPAGTTSRGETREALKPVELPQRNQDSSEIFRPAPRVLGSNEQRNTQVSKTQPSNNDARPGKNLDEIEKMLGIR